MKQLAAQVLAVLAVVSATACSDQATDPAKTSQLGGALGSAGTPITESATPLDIAVIGDTPYGNAAIQLFPTMVNAINSDPKVREVVHVGDLKSGSEQCTDARFQISL